MSTWSYIYILKIDSDMEKKIQFCDGEVESVQWLTVDDIFEKIKNSKNITQGSIVCFKNLFKGHFLEK